VLPTVADQEVSCSWLSLKKSAIRVHLKYQFLVSGFSFSVLSECFPATAVVNRLVSRLLFIVFVRLIHGELDIRFRLRFCGSI
jgi:hypothetical protein